MLNETKKKSMLDKYLILLAGASPCAANTGSASHPDINLAPNWKSKVNRPSGDFCAALAPGVPLWLPDAAPAQGFGYSRGFDQPDNILMADQFNNRVIEIDTAGAILWSIGLRPHRVDASV